MSRFFYFSHEYRRGFIRIFNFGVKWKDISIHGLTFSQRYEIEKGIQIGVWRIGFLN